MKKKPTTEPYPWLAKMPGMDRFRAKHIEDLLAVVLKHLGGDPMSPTLVEKRIRENMNIEGPVADAIIKAYRARHEKPS